MQHFFVIYLSHYQQFINKETSVIKNSKQLLSILIMLFLSISLYGQFKAKMVFNSMGKERAFTVYSADAGYRYEFNEDGQKGIVIVNKN